MLMEKSYIKYLGIIIDSTYFVFPIKSLELFLGVMCKLRTFLNQKILINLYYGIFYYHLVYSIQTWGNALGTELSKKEHPLKF